MLDTFNITIVLPGSAAILAAIADLKKAMTMTNDELLASLTSLSASVTKIGTETSASLAKIAELQATIDAAGGVPQSVQDAVTALQAQLQGVDDLVPDAPVEQPV